MYTQVKSMVSYWRQQLQLLFKKFQKKVRTLKLESYALACAYQDQRTPYYAKVSIIITLGYLLSPIDLIPDFIPILGYLDDLILVPLLIILSIKLIPNDILNECREKSRISLNAKQKLKKSWWFAFFVVLFYSAVFYVIFNWLKDKWFILSHKH